MFCFEHAMLSRNNDNHTFWSVKGANRREQQGLICDTEVQSDLTDLGMGDRATF